MVRAFKPGEGRPLVAFDVHGMLEALRKRDPFTTYLEKKHGSLLPPARH